MRYTNPLIFYSLAAVDVALLPGVVVVSVVVIGYVVLLVEVVVVVEDVVLVVVVAGSVVPLLTITQKIPMHTLLRCPFLFQDFKPAMQWFMHNAY